MEAAISSRKIDGTICATGRISEIAVIDEQREAEAGKAAHDRGQEDRGAAQRQDLPVALQSGPQFGKHEGPPAMKPAGTLWVHRGRDQCNSVEPGHRRNIPVTLHLASARPLEPRVRFINHSCGGCNGSRLKAGVT